MITSARRSQDVDISEGLTVVTSTHVHMYTEGEAFGRWKCIGQNKRKQRRFGCRSCLLQVPLPHSQHSPAVQQLGHLNFWVPDQARISSSMFTSYAFASTGHATDQQMVCKVPMMDVTKARTMLQATMSAKLPSPISPTMFFPLDRGSAQVSLLTSFTTLGKT